MDEVSQAVTHRPARAAQRYARRAALAQVMLARLRGSITPVVPKTPTAAPLRLANLRNWFTTTGLRLWSHGLLLVLVSSVLIGELLGAWSFQATQPSDPTPPAPIVLGPEQADSAIVPGIGAPLAIAPIALMVDAPSEPLAPQLMRPIELPGAFQADHTLVAGETLGELATRYGITVESLVWANRLEQGDALVDGQVLRIPRVAGLNHTVAAGDTLELLAERFAVAPEAIASFGPNRLEASLNLIPGTDLFIPGGTRPLPEAWLRAVGGLEGLASRGPQVAGIVQATQTNLRTGPSTEHPRVLQLDAGRRVALLARYSDWVQVALGPEQGWVRADLLALAPEVVAGLPENRTFPAPPPRWVWPARGTLSSRFGPRWGRFHNGIDIANRAWTPVVAARTGRVSEAGWCSGYGYCVKIRHDGGVETHYGHLVARPPVRVGDEVNAGQLIGYMGSTYDRAGGGYSTGVHLHFTVLINGRAVDPLRVLP
ncbi:MAG: peptidoglycan DD-metalloendopeptidase family protein [Oscillochloridaceae bacterium umkhey_bin13]